MRHSAGTARISPQWSLKAHGPGGHRLSTDRQWPDTDPRLLDDDHAPGQKVACDLLQVVYQKGELSVGTAVGATPEEDDRGLALSTDGKESAEVGISGHQDPVFPRCQCEHLLVGSGLHATISQVDGIVSYGAQTGGNARRDRVVHEELQEAALIGISRSRTLSAA